MKEILNVSPFVIRPGVIVSMVLTEIRWNRATKNRRPVSWLEGADKFPSVVPVTMTELLFGRNIRLTLSCRMVDITTVDDKAPDVEFIVDTNISVLPKPILEFMIDVKAANIFPSESILQSWLGIF